MNSVWYMRVPKALAEYPDATALFAGQYVSFRHKLLSQGLYVDKSAKAEVYDQDADNFVRNLLTIVVRHNVIRIPRIIKHLKLRKYGVKTTRLRPRTARR